jgi:hypothetical protein
MTNFVAEINAALLTDEKIPREQVLLWIEAAADLTNLAKLYRLTGEAYHRIQPELERETTCSLIQRYLLECIRQDVTESEVQGRWEAAGSLHAWFRHLVEMEGTSTVVAVAAQAVTDLFLAGGEDVRIAIEQGFLEHALETVALRPYFESWSLDARLHPAWERAMEWGEAHPDFTWGLLQQLRRSEI